MTKRDVLGRQIRHNMEPAIDQTTVISDNSKHRRTLHGECRKLNAFSADEYLRGTTLPVLTLGCRDWLTALRLSSE